jgi:PHD/YefM family antitoxin component YafN of YafNO toxin-antitoxin module
VTEAAIQYVSIECGEPAAVIVPISLWRDIASERETAYLLKSESMKRRLLEAGERQHGLSLDEITAKVGI